MKCEKAVGRVKKGRGGRATEQQQQQISGLCHLSSPVQTQHAHWAWLQSGIIENQEKCSREIEILSIVIVIDIRCISPVKQIFS